MKRKKNLVDYSDSDFSNEDEKKVKKKIKISEETDFKYPINLDGNFPSFIYIEIGTNTFLEKMQGDIIKIMKNSYEFIPQTSLHISLSQTLALTLYQIEGFLKKIKSKKKLSIL